MADLKKLFVLVPSGTITGSTTIDTIKTASLSINKIYFVEDTNEIVAKGVTYGASADVVATVGSLSGLLHGSAVSGALFANKTTIDSLSGLVHGSAISGAIKANADAISVLNGGADKEGSVANQVSKAIANIVDADSDDTINKLQEVVDWFAGLSATGSGSGAIALITSVSENTQAIGKQKTETTEATGLYKYVDDAVSGAINGSDDLIKSLSGTVDNLSGALANTIIGLATSGTASDANNLVSVDWYEQSGIVNLSGVTVKTSNLGEVGLDKVDGKWVAGSANTAIGLAKAADVASELVADEEVIAAALNDHETRLLAVEGGELSIASVLKGGSDASGHVTVNVTTENGSVSNVEVSVSDVASAADLNTLSGQLYNDKKDLSGFINSVETWDMWEQYN